MNSKSKPSPQANSPFYFRCKQCLTTYPYAFGMFSPVCCGRSTVLTRDAVTAAPSETTDIEGKES